MAVASGAGTGLLPGGFDGFHHPNNNTNTITSNQINQYLLDHQGHGQGQLRSHPPTTTTPSNFFPTQNPSYAAQPASSTGSIAGAGAFGGQATSQQKDSTSSNADQLLQQLLQQQVDLQNQINAQMQLNAASSHNSAQQAQAQAQAQAQLSSSSTSYQQQQPGDSDLLNLWQQINADVSNLDNSIAMTGASHPFAANAAAVNPNQFVTTPGIASFLAGNESLGALAAATAAAPAATSATSATSAAASFLQQQQQPPRPTNSTQELTRFLMNAEPDSFDVSLRNTPLSMAGASTGALGAAGASSLFGGNAGWSSANLAGGAGVSTGISSLAAQANANILANLHGSSNAAAAAAAAAAAGDDNIASSNSAAAEAHLGMLNHQGSGSGPGSGGGY